MAAARRSTDRAMQAPTRHTQWSRMRQWVRGTWLAMCLGLALIFTGLAHAQLTIEIIGGGATQTPIPIAPFAADSDYPLRITGVIGAALQHTGLFRLVEPTGARPADPAGFPFADYRA